MIEERARVARVDGDGIYVEALRQSACSSCKLSSGCGNSLLDNIFPSRRRMVRVLPYEGLKKGDEVIIGLHEGAMLKGAFIVYSVPLLFMVVLAMLVSLMFPAAADGLIVLAGMSGLLIGLAWLRFFSASIRYDKRYQPVVLRKV